MNDKAAREFVVDIFDEVNEDLRAERAQKLLMRYGGVIVAVAIAIVGAAGAWQAWHWWQAKQDSAAATAYVGVMGTADSTTPSGIAARPGTAAALEGIATNAPEGYRILARLRAAALKSDLGDAAGAAALWDQVAGDTSAPPVLRDLASLLWAEHQVDHGDPALVAARLQALAAPGGTWRAMAQEQLALLDLRQGKNDAAKDTLRKLADDVTAPSGVRGRASSLVSKLGG
ncbi:MAG: tetratricopeptide repeat protein [Acetobacteraceae bacterium]|nr:tetratricopeptide repeat protein [Acetobacteraceae bacterium]